MVENFIVRNKLVPHKKRCVSAVGEVKPVHFSLVHCGLCYNRHHREARALTVKIYRTTQRRVYIFRIACFIRSKGDPKLIPNFSFYSYFLNVKYDAHRACIFAVYHRALCISPKVVERVIRTGQAEIAVKE
jgi:hypothetical protein